MANFCGNCGSPLKSEAKFCPSCGAPVKAESDQQNSFQQPAQQPVNQQPAQQPVPAQQQPTPAPQPVQQTPQPAVQQRYAAPQQRYASRAPKKGGKAALIIIIAVVVVAAIIGAVCFFGLRDGGFLRGNKTNTYDAQSMQSLRDYAKQLEEAGNSEAAAAVYELIGKGGGAEFIEKAHEDIPIIKAADEVEQFKNIAGQLKGGSGE